MANIKSAIKRAQLAEARRLRNKSIRSRVRTALRRFEEALSAGDLAGADERLRKAVSLLDRAARKRVIHPNAAARRKSRLVARLRAAQK